MLKHAKHREVLLTLNQRRQGVLNMHDSGHSRVPTQSRHEGTLIHGCNNVVYLLISVSTNILNKICWKWYDKLGKDEHSSAYSCQSFFRIVFSRIFFTLLIPWNKTSINALKPRNKVDHAKSTCPARIFHFISLFSFFIISKLFLEGPTAWGNTRDEQVESYT